MAKFFGYETVADEAGISPEDLGAIRRRVQAEYPDDEMMQELRLLRTCSAIKMGACTVPDAIRPETQGHLPVCDEGSADRH